MRLSLSNFFHLEENKTTVATEIIAGLTTFITMAYILAVMPILLAKTGMDKNAVFLGTAIASCLCSILMGIFVNWPIAMAPAMGYNVYFATIAAQTGGIASWQMALGMVFASGIIMLILTATKIRQILITAIPDALKHGIIVGIGLFITLIGLKMSGIITINLQLAGSLPEIIGQKGIGTSLTSTEWDFALGHLKSANTLLAVVGLTITAILMGWRIKGALLIGIIASTLIGIPLGITKIHSLHFALPSFSSANFGVLNIKDIWHFNLVAIIFSLTFIALMDTFGTLISVTNGTDFTEKKNYNAKLGKSMLVDSAGVMFGSMLGVSTMTAYIESSAGIRAGGKTGLTAVTVGILFFIAAFLAPLFQLIPSEAIAPALIIVGLLMLSNIAKINMENFAEVFPAFLSILLIPLTFNIAYGITAGIIFYTLLKITTGQGKQLHWMMYVLTGLSVLHYLI